jgi:hypothetical protein
MAAATILAAAFIASETGPVTAQAKKHAPGQSLGIASMANLRDVGGYPARRGCLPHH